MMQIPFIDHVVRVVMSEKPLNVQDQTCITSDRAPVIIHMLVYSRIIDPVKYASQASLDRQDFQHLSSSTLKEMVGTRLLDGLLSGREELGEAICTRLNTQIDPASGMRISKVEIMEIVISKEILASTPVPGEFPPECPACGAPLDTSASHAARQYKCEYCGFLIKR
jgi:erythrocyte band 7 integral membrane protein